MSARSWLLWELAASQQTHDAAPRMRRWNGACSQISRLISTTSMLRSIITDACDELKIPYDHAGLAARVTDLYAEGRPRHEIIEVLRTEVCIYW